MIENLLLLATIYRCTKVWNKQTNKKKKLDPKQTKVKNENEKNRNNAPKSSSSSLLSLIVRKKYEKKRKRKKFKTNKKDVWRRKQRQWINPPFEQQNFQQNVRSTENVGINLA